MKKQTIYTLLPVKQMTTIRINMCKAIMNWFPVKLIVDWWEGSVSQSTGQVGGQDDHVIAHMDLLWLVYALCTYV